MSSPSSADLELKIERPGDRYTLTLRLRPGDHVSAPFVTALNPDALLPHTLTPETYGRALHDALFAEPEARATFLQYRAVGLAAGRQLRVRLFLPDELQRLRWELLPDPASGRPLALGAPLLLSRYLSADDFQPLQLRPHGELRALIAIAAPADAGESLLPAHAGAWKRRARHPKPACVGSRGRRG